MCAERSARAFVIQSKKGFECAFDLVGKGYFFANLDDASIRIENSRGWISRCVGSCAGHVDTVEFEHLAVLVGEEAIRNVLNFGQYVVCTDGSAGNDENAGDQAIQPIMEIQEVPQ